MNRAVWTRWLLAGMVQRAGGSATRSMTMLAQIKIGTPGVRWRSCRMARSLRPGLRSSECREQTPATETLSINSRQSPTGSAAATLLLIEAGRQPGQDRPISGRCSSLEGRNRASSAQPHFRHQELHELARIRKESAQDYGKPNIKWCLSSRSSSKLANDGRTTTRATTCLGMLIESERHLTATG